MTVEAHIGYFFMYVAPLAHLVLTAVVLAVVLKRR